jgi:hypothetical protein
MPPRLNKRQQRELEELEALGSAPNPQEEGASAEGEEDDAPAPAAAGGFAAVRSRRARDSRIYH